MPKKRSASSGPLARKYRLNARPDTVDFRDKMYEATLVEVPPQITLADFKKKKVPILDQGQEGACTGFGLATVANYLLRGRKVQPDKTEVSPRMLYEMAKRYDEWPGTEYDGSSARGAMKGWYKHGICARSLWPYDPRKPDPHITDKRAVDALHRPLGAYYRVNHKDVVALHAALTEVGILYATATVHQGWDRVDNKTGAIPFDESIQGGHAFAIVAYDHRGLWIQNSWGPSWGLGGFALVTYDDWLANGNDVWVARLAAPVSLQQTGKVVAVGAKVTAPAMTYSFADLRPHIVSIGNDGALRQTDTFGTTEHDVKEVFQNFMPTRMKPWKRKRILLYAHGGLVAQDVALQRVAEYREALLKSEIYPLAFIWKTDYWTTVKNILSDAVRTRRPEGFWDDTKDFMLDRVDDALEALARTLTGKAVWDEMKENALLSTANSNGGARIVLQHLVELMRKDPSIEVHVLAHSAGSIFLAPLVQMLTAQDTIVDGPMKGSTGHHQKVATCTLWAPACTSDLFKRTYLPSIKNGAIGQFTLFTLTDQAEQNDHCAKIYNKSLLYLVSNALEETPRIPVIQKNGTPILGMEKFVQSDPELVTLFTSGKTHWITAPNGDAVGTNTASRSQSHGDFDDDGPTLQATLARILDTATSTQGFETKRSARSLREMRRALSRTTDGERGV